MYRAQGDTEKAIETFRRAMNADSRLRDPVINLAALYIEMDDPDFKYSNQAIEYYQKLRAEDPTDFTVTFNLGLCWLKQQNKSKSRQILGEAVKLAPDNPKAQYALGQAYGK